MESISLAFASAVAEAEWQERTAIGGMESILIPESRKSFAGCSQSEPGGAWLALEASGNELQAMFLSAKHASIQGIEAHEEE